MKRTILLAALLASLTNLSAQNSLTKIWERDYTSTSTYNFPQYLVYARPIPSCAPNRPGLFVVGKTGNGEIFINDYDITTGSDVATRVYQNDTYSGSNFYLGVAQNNGIRASDTAYSNLVFTVVSSKTNASGDHLMFTQTHDPGDLTIWSSVTDTVTYINPADTLIRNNVCLPDGITSHVLSGFFKKYFWLTSYNQDYSLIGDPANCSIYNPFPQFYPSWCSDPQYVPVSTGLCTYWIIDNAGNGCANGWFGNYKNASNPSQRKIVVKARARNAFSYMANSILELSADSCSLFEADFIDRLELADPTTHFALVVRKQYDSNPLCNYYLYLLDVLPDGLGAPVPTVHSIIPITSLTNQGLNKSRTVMLKVHHQKIYVVLSATFGDTYTYCYDWSGNLLWQQAQLFDNCSVGVDCDSSGIYLGSKSGFGSGNPGYYEIIHYNASNGYKSLDYVDGTKSGMITDLKLDETGQYIFVTGYGNDGAQQVVKTVKYTLSQTSGIAGTSPGGPEVSPVPANDLLQISGWKDGAYTLLDMEGRKVAGGQYMAELAQVNVQGLTPGVYLLELHKGTQHLSRRIIISH